MLSPYIVLSRSGSRSRSCSLLQDPVNTASKLGEDIAVDQDLLITETVFASLGAEEGLRFAPRTFFKSHVEFTAYSVLGPHSDGGPEAAGEYVLWKMASPRLA